MQMRSLFLVGIAAILTTSGCRTVQYKIDAPDGTQRTVNVRSFGLRSEIGDFKVKTDYGVTLEFSDFKTDPQMDMMNALLQRVLQIPPAPTVIQAPPAQEPVEAQQQAPEQSQTPEIDETDPNSPYYDTPNPTMGPIDEESISLFVSDSPTIWIEEPGVYENMRIQGQVVILADDVVLRNFIIEGGEAAYGISGSGKNILVENGRIDTPQMVEWGKEQVKGQGITIRNVVFTNKEKAIADSVKATSCIFLDTNEELMYVDQGSH